MRLLLEGEFYADRFEEIYRVAWEAAGEIPRPLGFHLIWSIFRDLDHYWRERPLTEQTAKRLEDYLRAPIIDYLDALPMGLSPELEMEYLNSLARLYREWLLIQRDIPRGT
jgi:hypothetical protein